MKKLILTAAAVFALGIANAQEQTKSGKLLVEVNTGFGQNVGGTGLQFASTDGKSTYNIGAEGGYFVMDNLALKVGLGFGGVPSAKLDPATLTITESTSTTIGYKIGAKYYVANVIPVEVSYNGQSETDVTKNPSYVGIQAGYAVFLGDMVSLEPGLRYNYALLNKDDGGLSFLQFNVGFVLHF